MVGYLYCCMPVHFVKTVENTTTAFSFPDLFVRLLFLPFRVKLPYVAFHMLPRLILKELKRHSCHWDVAFLRTCLMLALILFVTVILL